MFPSGQSNVENNFGLNLFTAPQQGTTQNPFMNTQTNPNPNSNTGFGSTFCGSSQNNPAAFNNGGTGFFSNQTQNAFGATSNTQFSTQPSSFFSSSATKPVSGIGQNPFGAVTTGFGQQSQGTIGGVQQSNLFGAQPNNTSSGMSVFGGQGTGFFSNTSGQNQAMSGNACIFNMPSKTSADVMCVRIIDKTDFVYGLMDGTVAIGSTSAQNLPIYQTKLSSPVLSLAVNSNKVIFAGTMNGLYAIQFNNQPAQIGMYSGPVFQVAVQGKYLVYSEMLTENGGPKRINQQSKQSWSAQISTNINADQLPIAYVIKVGSYESSYKQEVETSEAACSGKFFLAPGNATSTASLTLVVPNMNSDKPFFIYSIRQSSLGSMGRINIAEETTIGQKIGQIMGNKRVTAGVVGCCYDRSSNRLVIVNNDRCVYTFDINNKTLSQKQVQYPIMHVHYSDYHRLCLFTAGTEIAYYNFNASNDWGKVSGISYGEICGFDVDEEKAVIAIGSANALYRGVSSPGSVSIVIVNLPSTRQGMYSNTYHTLNNKVSTMSI